MTTYTHTFTERGNGYPQDGATVLQADDNGWHTLLRVVSTGPIVTGQPGEGGSIELVCEPAEADYDDLDDAAAEAAYADLHHVQPIALPDPMSTTIRAVEAALQGTSATAAESHQRHIVVSLYGHQADLDSDGNSPASADVWARLTAAGLRPRDDGDSGPCYDPSTGADYCHTYTIHTI